MRSRTSTRDCAPHDSACWKYWWRVELCCPSMRSWKWSQFTLSKPTVILFPGGWWSNCNQLGLRWRYWHCQSPLYCSQIWVLHLGLTVDPCLQIHYLFWGPSVYLNLNFWSYFCLWLWCGCPEEFIIRYGNLARGQAHSFFLLVIFMTVLVCASCLFDSWVWSYVPSLHWNGGALTWKEELLAKDTAFSSGWTCSSFVEADLAVCITESEILVANDRIRSGVSNSLGTDITLLLLLWLLQVTEAATRVSSLLLWSCIGGIRSETLYHVKGCVSLSDTLCSPSLLLRLIALWQEEAQSLNRLFCSI
jgi:hypothetical protein